FHAMFHATEGYLAATNELMSIHVSEATRRSTSMAPEVLERLARIQKAHDALPRPPQIGRTIGLASPPTTRQYLRRNRILWVGRRGPSRPPPISSRRGHVHHRV